MASFGQRDSKGWWTPSPQMRSPEAGAAKTYSRAMRSRFPLRKGRIAGGAAALGGLMYMGHRRSSSSNQNTPIMQAPYYQ